MTETIQVKKAKYNEMVEHIERLRETVEVLSNSKTVRKLERAIARVESGKFLTKKELGL